MRQLGAKKGRFKRDELPADDGGGAAGDVGLGEDEKKRRLPYGFSSTSSSSSSSSSASSSVAAVASTAAAAAAAMVRRGAGSGGAAGGLSLPYCQAERCTADLTEAKRYHRRHKVCEAHSKAAVVLVAGLRQRFCQQCSRFHELSEFDEAKRSCRRRLAGHNERRRKSSSESQGEGSGHCRQVDQSGRMPIATLPANPAFKHFHIR
ncbi:unnamed protein product [Spirodela intermedia]|uniref:SBP-type domain-containing protein n=2 Tax=Spirodela intermedia TaxID=51605 RepID=A0A7I8K9B6_SPIIN|nr:unnamed protein product [Spirodela intermedia]CAA6658167.1 unnamed protein product [Spirodela intermedia]CAA7394347.1 unnamed protein product [Spirodela intermedia]